MSDNLKPSSTKDHQQNVEEPKSSTGGKSSEQPSKLNNELSQARVKEQPVTPAIQRIHRTLRNFNVHSPSDSIMSPCSQKLADASRVRKGHQAHQEKLNRAQLNFKYGQTSKEPPAVDFDTSFRDENEHQK